MKQPEQHIQSVFKQDIVPLSVGGGFLGFASLADMAEVFQQVGVILGTILVAVTLAHRIFMFWKDAHKD